MTAVTQTDYRRVVSRIIKHQEYIVGPLAWSEARKVSGLVIKGEEVTVEGEGKKTIELLVGQYSALFGKASVEVCREAVKSIINPDEKQNLPEILQ